ncbi:immunity 49 family protein [Pelistega suis]|uniref:Immunity 49 family protein n=2 Tax=Pelistega suis TaxID=1631957 RepID=A0A849PA48_9BURK|nr:immunity 49 family protein [Pelistega suis]
MPRRRKNLVMEKYKVYLGSIAERSYQESIDFCKGYAGELDVTNPNHYMVDQALEIIKTGVGNPFACMEQIGVLYKGQSSVDLVVHGDVQAFKQNAYVAAKLWMLGRESARWGYFQFGSMCFLSLCSDNPDLKEFLITQQDIILGPLEQVIYKHDDIRFYLERLILLALAGDWERLREGCLRFLNDEKHSKAIEADFRFFLAMSNQDAEEMKQILNEILEYWISTKVTIDLDIHFDFYLYLPVLTYAKIAMIHGYDLGIDSPIAPKELIEVRPLASYEDPYDFMKEFDFHQPQQIWIDRWKAKMEAGLAWRAREQKKLKNRILRFLGRGGIDLQPRSPIDEG